MAEGGGSGCPAASRNAHSQHPWGTQLEGAQGCWEAAGHRAGAAASL